MKSNFIVKGFACFVAMLFLNFQSSPSASASELVDIDFSVYIPCANDGLGEEVIFSGTLHVVSTFTINDNNISGFNHFQPQGLKGTGVITGTQYNATGVTQYGFNGSLINGSYEEMFVNNFRIIGPKTDNNLLVHSSGHITINANGDMTVTHDSFTEECR
jgi:hypothetical protein